MARLTYFGRVSDAPTDHDHDGRLLYSTMFRWSKSAGDAPKNLSTDPRIAVYENDLLLGSPYLEYVKAWDEYSLVFSTSDDSNPRLNGRSYWIVVQPNRCGEEDKCISQLQ